MTQLPKPEPGRNARPSRRDRLKPLEFIGFALVLAVFAGLVVLFTLRTPDGVVDFGRAGIVAGCVFIGTLVMLALLGLGGKPSDEDVEARKDLQGPDKENWH